MYREGKDDPGLGVDDEPSDGNREVSIESVSSACSVCGHSIEQGINVKLEEAAVWIDGKHINMEPIKVSILEAIIRAHGIARPEYIAERAWDILATPESLKVIQVHICNMRKHLSGTRLEIRTIWNVGYKAIWHKEPFYYNKKVTERWSKDKVRRNSWTKEEEHHLDSLLKTRTRGAVVSYINKRHYGH